MRTPHAVVLFLAFCLMFSLNASAQSISFVRSDFASGLEHPLAVAAGDFNRDGKLDLAVAEYALGSVSILLGNGDKTFGPKTEFLIGDGSSSVVVADLNGDGKLDLAVANTASATISILLGTGDGTFSNKPDVPTAINPISVIAADLNGDGKLDLAVANATIPPTVSVFWGNGDGTFQSGREFATAFAPLEVISGDFNGDGKLDLATTNGATGTISILLGNGDGTFGAHSDITVAAVNSYLLVATGDFNGDGKLDLAVSSRGAGTIQRLSFVSVLLGNGDGTFGPKTDFPTGVDTNCVATADLNGDGKLDLVTADNGDTISVLVGNGDGTFGPPRSFPRVRRVVCGYGGFQPRRRG